MIYVKGARLHPPHIHFSRFNYKKFIIKKIYKILDYYKHFYYYKNNKMYKNYFELKKFFYCHNLKLK